MHQQAATSHYNSAQAGTQHYQGQSSIAMMSQSNQGNSMMGQRPMGPYRPSQQGKQILNGVLMSSFMRPEICAWMSSVVLSGEIQLSFMHA